MDNADLGRLLSLISHEVRSPLGVIRGYLRLLEQRGPELSDQHRHAVSAALKASERAAELLAQVSLLAEVSRQETAFAFESTRLDEVLSAATEAVVLPKEPKVTLDVAPVAPVEVRADWNLLRVALTGIVSAVVRAQPSDVTVIISTREETRSASAVDSVVVIEITVGDSDDVAEQPLDLTRGGLGLDLPLAAALIAAHGGEVRERHRGTRLLAVVVSLPVER